MDQLELLKEQWKNREQELPTLSYNTIYEMLLKRSSSIVKWIFYISVCEIILWTLLAFLVPESSKEINEGMGLRSTLMIINAINYIIFAIFIFLFYINYRSIKVTDSIKSLMANILKTRRTVMYFVIYNVGATFLLLAFVNFHYYMNKEDLYHFLIDNFEGYGAISLEKFTTIFFLSQLFGGLVLIGLLLIFYRVVYGILLKRLYNNYKELKKLEV